MRLVYFGTSEFAVPALKALSAWITLVVTQPPRPKGRGRHLTPTPVAIASEELGLPIFSPERARTLESVERVRAEQADALLVASYGQILSEEMLGSARLGGINLHASLLPKYRGAAPIQRAILEGESETGITLMQMNKGMDTGDIITQARAPISPDETAGELEARLAEIAADVAKEWMPRIASGPYPREPQSENLATLAPKLAAEEASLNFEMSAAEAYTRFRASTPRPGCTLKGTFGSIRLLECRLGGDGVPGQLVAIDGDAAVLGFREGTLQLRLVRPEGRATMTGAAWANGQRLKPGDLLD